MKYISFRAQGFITRIRYEVSRFLRKFGIGFDARKHPAVIAMWEDIDSLKDSTIVFDLYIEENGDWSAVSRNVDGLMTGGRPSDGIIENVVDAIFTYYDVPPEYCDERVLSRDYMFAEENAPHKLVFNFSRAEMVAA